ncbi:MAG: ABC transporter permease [Anaerolineae bacterium]
MNWGQFLSYGFLVGLFAGAVRLSVPIILAALGETFSERAGILNIGVEGMMITGAFVGFVAADQTGGNLLVGILAAGVSGAIMGLIMAVFSVTLQANQNVTGISLIVLSDGIAIFFFRVIYGMTLRVPTIEPMEPIAIPLLSQIPFLGPVLFTQNAMVYAVLLLTAISTVILFRTPLGLRIEAVGENPHAADSVGVNVVWVRYLAVIIGGVLAALGGAYITLGDLGLWTDLVTGGRGFIALALVNFGGWSPVGTLLGGLLFGLIDATQTRLQSMGAPVPPQLMIAMPYLLTIVVLVIASRRGGQAPSALTKPFKRGEA